MKSIHKAWFLATIFLLFLTSCDTFYCGRSVFVNSSDHSISILVYQNGQIVTRTSMIEPLPPGGRDTLGARYCRRGWTASPFVGSYGLDSVAIIFNDTLRVPLFSQDNESFFYLFGEKNPLLLVYEDVWKEVPRPDPDDGGTVYFEYEFTNWHFEQAVEFSRR